MDEADKFTLEVCIDNFESAKAAIDGGADRLEVCSALILGGLTPSKGLLSAIRDYLKVEQKTNVHLSTMIRSRSGDFFYSPEEIEVMKTEIELLRDVSDSFVFGCLIINDGVITCNPDQCKTLLQTCGDKPATFHRAIDVCTHKLDTCGNLVSMGFARLLTSGGYGYASGGCDTIKDLQSTYGDRIKIMAGSGVCRANVGGIYKDTLVTNYHASCSKECVSPIATELDRLFLLGVSRWKVTTVELVMDLRKEMDEIVTNKKQ